MLHEEPATVPVMVVNGSRSSLRGASVEGFAWNRLVALVIRWDSVAGNGFPIQLLM